MADAEGYALGVGWGKLDAVSLIPAEPDGPWHRFTADPRTAGFTLASDADRDAAGLLIASAFHQGRLTPEEHADRLSRALQVRRLGELVPLVSDLPDVASAPLMNVRRSLGIRSAAIRGWVGLAALFNVIWVFTVFTAGHLIYYWPMWPMLGLAIPALFGWVKGGRPAGDGQPPQQIEGWQQPPSNRELR